MFLSDAKYEKWTFVLGTAIGHSPIAHMREEIFNVALVRKGGVKVTETAVSAKDRVFGQRHEYSATNTAPLLLSGITRSRVNKNWVWFCQAGTLAPTTPPQTHVGLQLTANA